MRIVFFSGELPPRTAGGVGSFVVCLAPALAMRGHEVEVISCAADLAARDWTVDGVTYHERPLRRFVPAVRRGWYTTRRINTAISCWLTYRSLGIKADVIEAPDWMAEALAVQIFTRAPTVVTLHTPVHLIFDYNDFAIGRDVRTADRLERVSARRAAALSSPSRLLSDELMASGWLRSRPAIVPHPIDLSKWKVQAEAGSAPAVVLVVGRLEPRKAPEVAVDSVALLCNEVPDLQLVFVGSSGVKRDGLDYRHWLKRRAEDKGVAVRFIDPVPPADLVEIYGSARVVAVPSRFESFSMVMLEAMASGRPVVCSDGVGAGELIIGTEAGKVTQKEDSEALSSALLPYLTSRSLASYAGAIGRAVVEKSCAPAIVAARHEELYAVAI